MKMLYTVILEPEPESGYSVHCPALPGVAAQGETVEESLANIQDAIRDGLNGWAEDGMAPPLDTPQAVAEELYEVLVARAEEGLPMTVETRQVEVPLEGAEEPRRYEAGEEIPVVLTVPQDPRNGTVKRGALHAFIRHSGLSPGEFLDYVGEEADRIAEDDGR